MATSVEGDGAHGGFKTVFLGMNLQQMNKTGSPDIDVGHRRPS